ncbi:MAG: hypothetical protein N2255_01245 [Kiritimatiellae bacterium]|nr:hypothetical protein [Kiritimatiellia bacterium]
MNATTITLMLALAVCEAVWCYRLLPSVLGTSARRRPRQILRLSIVLVTLASVPQLLVTTASFPLWVPFLVPPALIPVAGFFLARHALISLRRAFLIVGVFYVLHTGVSMAIMAPLLVGGSRGDEAEPLSASQDAESLLSGDVTGMGSQRSPRLARNAAKLPSRVQWHDTLRAVQRIAVSPGSGIHIVNLQCLAGGTRGEQKPRFEITGTADAVTNHMAALIAALREATPPGYKIYTCRGMRVGSFEMERSVEKEIPFNIFLAYEVSESTNGNRGGRSGSGPDGRDSPIASNGPPDDWAIKRTVRNTTQRLGLATESLTDGEYLFSPIHREFVSSAAVGVLLRAKWGYESLLTFVERIERENPDLQISSITVTSRGGYENMAVNIVVGPWFRPGREPRPSG